MKHYPLPFNKLIVSAFTLLIVLSACTSRQKVPIRYFEIPITESNLPIVRPPNKAHIINDSVCCVGVPYSDTLIMFNCINLHDSSSIKILHPDSIFNYFEMREKFIDLTNLDIYLADRHEWYSQYQYNIGNCYIWDIQTLEYPEVLITGNFVLRCYDKENIFPIFSTFAVRYNFSSDSLSNLYFLDYLKTDSIQSVDEWRYNNKFSISDEHLADASGIWGVQNSLNIPDDSSVSIFLYNNFTSDYFNNNFPIKYPDSIIRQFSYSLRSIDFYIELFWNGNEPCTVVENRQILSIESGELIRTIPADIAKDIIMWDDRTNQNALAALASNKDGLFLVNIPLDSNKSPYVFYTFPDEFSKNMYVYTLEHNQLVSIHLTGNKYTLKQHLFHE